MVTGTLIDVKEVFGRVDANHMAMLLAPELTNKTVPIVMAEIFGGEGSRLTEPLARNLVSEARVQDLVEAVITRVQADPEKYLDVEDSVVEALTAERALLVDLFQKVGAPELRFLVACGFWGGLALGILQMMLWLVWSPAWSLAATGALVGLVTDLIALRLMFTPVQPIYVGNLRIQGLFLLRQHEVAADFGAVFSRRN
eukprot:FR734430.1.p1 GENE.FR734430.1~~FR734430.1.p1  ORF type:complete len:234 (+),score=24.07 FR734430.1:108-704(+)